MPLLEWIDATIRKKKPVKSRAGLAKALGIDASQVTRMFQPGGRRLRSDELGKVSAYLEETIPPELVAATQPHDNSVQFDMTQEIQGDINPLHFPKDAIVELAQHAGKIKQMIYYRDTEQFVAPDAIRDDYWRFPFSFVHYVLSSAVDHMMVVECLGDSMAPTLMPGEKVWVDTLHTTLTHSGLYAIRNRAEAIVIKRLQGDLLRPVALVISDNEKHQSQEIPLDDLDIVGKVRCVLRMF